VIRQQLQRQNSQQRADLRVRVGDDDQVIAVGAQAGVLFSDGDRACAAHVVWVVGAQKIVPNLDEAFKRVREYTYPRGDERMLQAYGMNSNISKRLIVHKEVMPNRTTMIIVKENLGF
jgi:hypothetical protein